MRTFCHILRLMFENKLTEIVEDSLVPFVCRAVQLGM